MRNKTLDVRFTWARPERGFEWIRQNGELTLRWPSHKKGGYKERYSPPPNLFRIFAGLRTTEKIRGFEDEYPDILQFANDYGDILATPGSESRRNDRGTPGNESLIYDTSGLRTVRRYAWLSVWKQEIRRMRQTVRLWDRSNTGAQGARLDAQKKLQEEIAKALQDTETPRCAFVYLNPQLELIGTPKNLLAHMWLTLARLASGEIEERRCEMFASCGNFIYVGRGVVLQRGDTTTCSAACRQKKKRQAAKST